MDETVFGRKCFWTNVFLYESVFANLGESVPNRCKFLMMSHPPMFPITL